MIDVCNMQQIKLLLAKYGFHFSKSKGQNFLNQRWVPEQIVQGSQIDKDCGVIEIGPGFGPLTQELCKAAGKVVALELDTTLKPVLAETVGEFDNLEIIFTDAMKVDLPALVEEKFRKKFEFPEMFFQGKDGIFAEKYEPGPPSKARDQER